MWFEPADGEEDLLFIAPQHGSCKMMFYLSCDESQRWLFEASRSEITAPGRFCLRNLGAATLIQMFDAEAGLP